MNRLLKSALLEMRRDGVNLDPVQDLDALLTLAKLADAVTNPVPAIGEASLLRPTLQVGNVTLRHLSQGSSIFLVDVVAGLWWPDDVPMQNRAYAYCMAHTDQPEVLWCHQADRTGFLRAVKEWEKTVNVSAGELQKAIASFQQEGRADVPDRTPTSADYRAACGKLDALRTMPADYRTTLDTAIKEIEADEDNAPRSFGPVVEMLCREYGKDPEYWMWRISARDRGVIIGNLNERREAENRAQRGHGDDRLTRAHHAFSVFVDNLKKAKRP